MEFTLFGKKIFMNIPKNKNIFMNFGSIKHLIFYSFSFLLIPTLTFAAGSGMHSPIEQFVVKTLIDIKQNSETSHIPCFLADWGYLKNSDRDNLPFEIRLLKLENLEQLLAI